MVNLATVSQAGSASAPGPAHLDESSSAADTPPPGRRTYIARSYERLLERLAQQASMGRVPTTCDVLTWMDDVMPDVDGDYIESHSDLQAFGIHDAFDIMETEVCYLATMGGLDRGGAMRLRQFTRDHILVPLGLWATTPESIGTFQVQTDMEQIFQWQNGVEGGYVEDGHVEDVESVEDVKPEVEEVEEVEEVKDGESSDIEEIEGWSESELTVKEYNYGQWEEEI